MRGSRVRSSSEGAKIGRISEGDKGAAVWKRRVKQPPGRGRGGQREEDAFFGSEEVAGACGACGPREAVGAERRPDPRGCILPSLLAATRLPGTSCFPPAPQQAKK